MEWVTERALEYFKNFINGTEGLGYVTAEAGLDIRYYKATVASGNIRNFQGFGRVVVGISVQLALDLD